MDTIIEETSAKGERETIDKNNDTGKTCSKDNTPEDGSKEPNEDATSCSKDTTPNNGTKEPNGDAMPCSKDTTPNNGTKEPNGDPMPCSKDSTPNDGTKELNEDDISCSQDTTTTTGTKEPDGDVLSCNQDTTTTTGTKEPDGDVLSCNQDTTTTTGTKEPDGDVLSCNQDTTTTTGTKEPDGDVLSCSQDTTTTTGTKEPDGDVLSCNQDTTTTTGTKEPDGDVLSCSQDTTTTTGTKEPDGDVLSCNQDTTTTTGTKKPDGDVLSCSQDTTTTTGTKEPDGDVLSCNQDTTTTTGTKKPDGDVLSCNQDTTTTTGTKEPDGDVLSCNQDTTTTTGTKKPDGNVLSCSQDTTTTTGTKEPDGDVLPCNQDTTTTTGTKKNDGNVLSCFQDTTPSNGTKEPNRDASPINRKIEPNKDAMSKNDTEKLNVKVDTKLTETLAEAKSDTVENQERTQDLGFDCRSRVPEKTVNSKEKKKQAKQEKKKHKDDQTYSVPQNMYRGNDQSHNADKRRGRFDKDKKGEPGICGTKEEFVFFWKSQSPYSQWYISDFTVNGITFNCAEQYMMYSKAMLFHDKETADLILQESDPRNHKSLGRRVQNFDQKKWDKNCIDIVKRGNKAKFSQDKRLYKMIIDTHPKTLVEASPMDRIWGIGLAADDYRAHDRKKWRGKNLLGQALTEVRDELKQEEESGKHDKRDTASQNISETGTDNDDTQGSTDDRLKDETEKLNVKVDTKLTETLAEAKSDTVENQERTQDLGFDCKSRVPEKTVNSKEKKKQTKQEKKKHKDDKTYSVPQNMYRGNDQSHNVDKRPGRFKDKKGEPGICGTKEEFVFFWKSQSPYSQWYISDFTVNGITFNCAEQYMMYSKAMLFHDKETADLILQESDPRNHKSLGRRVQNFDQKKWDKNCIDIVKCGNKAKFSQDKRLYKMIIDTHPKTLVEASPMDRIWGIGLAADDYRADDRKKWRGKNLLGQALTEVRDELKQEEELGKHDKRDTASQNISETGTDNDDTQGSTDDRLKDETEKLNVKVDTKLTETLAEAKSDTVENQERTQDLGFDCKSRVPEKTVNSKEKKKQTKQEKKKHKDDKTYSVPQNMYRGNDQSHNVDKRPGRFKDKKGEPGICGTKEEFVFFWKSQSPYSQWYISDFTVNGITFNCAEQYMMYSKAMLFHDKETADLILQESDPRNHKSLGRRVQNFDQKKWDKNCIDIVKCGNKAKFSQDKRLYKMIIDTHPKTLVEASPMDRIWGIGLAADDYRAHDRKKWRGNNLLGQALTEVRDELKQEEESGKHDKRDTASQNISETGTDNDDTQGSTDDRLKDETENTQELKAKTTVPETGDMTGENNPLESCNQEETSQSTTSDATSDLPPSNIDVKSQVSTIKQVEKSQVSTIKQVEGDKTVATDNGEN